jgi:serine/threonine protein kinase
MAAGERLPERYRCLEVLRDDELEFLVRATDTVLQREVLIKAPGAGLLKHLLSAHDRDRVMREARALARLRHDNVVKLLDVTESAGTPLLVLEPVAGESLADRVARDGPLPPVKVAMIGRQLASALTAIHGAGAVHRSIAPENIILGEGDTPVLVGFGLAKFASKTGASSIYYQGGTADGAAAEFAVPLPRYPAPEQLLGSPADARTDVFSLGSTLEFALLGRDPLPQRAHEARPRETTSLGEILARSTARSTLQRYQSAAQLESALAALTELSLVAANASTAGHPAAPSRTIARSAQIAGVAAVLVVAIAVTLNSRNDGDANRGPTIALTPDAPTDEPNHPRFSADYEKSWALLIGIEDYEKPGFADLPNAESDVLELEKKLRSMEWENWEIRKLIGKEATKAGIIGALAQLADETKARWNDRVLVYYAGHGDRDEAHTDSGWIVPVDATPSETYVGRTGWIDHAEVSAQLKKIDAKHLLVLLDCCYGGVAATRGTDRSVARITTNLTQQARIVISSGQPHEAVPDGVGENSPFLQALMRALTRDSDYLTATMLGEILQEEAPKLGGKVGVRGVLTGHEGGDFMFFLKPRN